MTVNVTVVGLGRVGGSLARRLVAQDQIRLAGYDRDTGLARAAQNQGALHKAHLNMLEAVEVADLVLLTGPLAEQHEALRLIAPELRPGSVTATVGPLLAPPLAWAAELLAGRAERHFIACHPAFNPTQLYSGETGYEAASPALFERGLWAIAPAPGCAPEAARLVSDLVRLLGAFAYFVDPAEHDGLAAASEALPALLALVLMQAAAGSPGWSETRKIAERSFATATVAVVEADPDVLAANRENTLRYLDAALAELQTLRQQLAGGEAAALEAAMAQAAERRAAWLADRQKGDWEHLGEAQPKLPTATNMLGRFLVGGLLSKRVEDATGGESH
jgi:prephenate dehydrogenase